MRVHYYSSDWPHTRNLGDWLTVPLVQSLGHPAEVTDDPSRPILFGIGSVIESEHLNAAKGTKVVVWGSGVMNRGVGPNPDPRLDVRAVRGPITRDDLGLPKSIPLGDPAILAPTLLKLPPPKVSGEVLYVGHCGQPYTRPDGFDGAATMNVKESEALDLISRIAAAKFVASQSLHGCILAAAFGVPWSPHSPLGQERRTPSDKWSDWMLYLGLPEFREFPPTLTDSRAWWDRIGRNGKLRDTKPLLDAFPHDIEKER